MKNDFFSGKDGSQLYLERFSELCPKNAAVQSFQRFCPVLRAQLSEKALKDPNRK
jgi:hypothetical protein